MKGHVSSSISFFLPVLVLSKGLRRWIQNTQPFQALSCGNNYFTSIIQHRASAAVELKSEEGNQSCVLSRWTNPAHHRMIHSGNISWLSRHFDTYFFRLTAKEPVIPWFAFLAFLILEPWALMAQAHHCSPQKVIGRNTFRSNII